MAACPVHAYAPRGAAETCTDCDRVPGAGGRDWSGGPELTPAQRERAAARARDARTARAMQLERAGETDPATGRFQRATWRPA